MDLDLTIAVCAYNAERRLPLALEAIARMRVPASIRWECLVIDNRSSDGTGNVAEELGRKLGLPLQVVFEPAPGLIQARRKAVEVAKGEILSYVDDDNVVELDWAERCVEFFRDHPRAGVAGGRIDPIFEDPASRPADFQERFADALAIRDLGDAERRLLPPAQDPPCGAGMTGRTAVFRTILLDIGCHLSGRRGKALTSGEDTEIGLLVHKLGWEMWYTPALRMGHVLPAARLTQAYLDKLIAGGAQSGAWLDYLRGTEPRRSRLAYLRTWAGWRFLAAKMTMLGWVKGKNHPHAARFPFWSSQYRGKAAGYWELATTGPARKLDAAIAASARAAPADPAQRSPDRATTAVLS